MASSRSHSSFTFPVNVSESASSHFVDTFVVASNYCGIYVSLSCSPYYPNHSTYYEQSYFMSDSFSKSFKFSLLSQHLNNALNISVLILILKSTSLKPNNFVALSCHAPHQPWFSKIIDYIGNTLLLKG